MRSRSSTSVVLLLLAALLGQSSTAIAQQQQQLQKPQQILPEGEGPLLLPLQRKLRPEGEVRCVS